MVLDFILFCGNSGSCVTHDIEMLLKEIKFIKKRQKNIDELLKEIDF